MIMKNIGEIISQKSVYLNNWSGKIGVISDFEDIGISDKEYYAETSPYSNKELWQERKEKMLVALQIWSEVNILFASYGTADWEGDAWVLFERGGKLYEVNASHCSCFGLEGQFKPEEASLPELENRIINGTWFGEGDCGGNTFKSELCEFLGISREE